MTDHSSSSSANSCQTWGWSQRYNSTSSLSALQVLAEGACGDQGGYVLGWRGPQFWIQSQTAPGA